MAITAISGVKAKNNDEKQGSNQAPAFSIVPQGLIGNLLNGSMRPNSTAATPSTSASAL